MDGDGRTARPAQEDDEAMESRNPILNNSRTFNRQAAARYGQQGYPAGGRGYSGYGQLPGGPGQPLYTDPSTWQTGGPRTPTLTEPMTLDSVISRTGVTLLTVLLVAAGTWVVLPNSYSGTAWIGGALAGVGIGLFLSFRAKPLPPAAVIAYAVAQGFFLGAASEAFEAAYPGVVVGALLGTAGAFVATLTAYKVFNIQVRPGFQKFMMIAGLGFFVVVFFDFALSLFGSAIGFNGFGPLGMLMSVIGLALGIGYLILDFNMIEQGIAAGAPESESWRAAFALTASLVLIYIELLRILAILRDN
jgi:uncharacterized YccA/Bax inhibitor family protein